MADTVEQSATMLLLETDPCNRGPRPSYRLWYQEIAAGYLKNALHDVEERKKALGTSAWANMLQQNKRLALLRADALLARDQIHEEIAYVSDSYLLYGIGGLRSMILIHRMRMNFVSSL